MSKSYCHDRFVRDGGFFTYTLKDTQLPILSIAIPSIRAKVEATLYGKGRKKDVIIVSITLNGCATGAQSRERAEHCWRSRHW